MGSKKYIGKTCVYCAASASTTGDHVFARAFFLEDKRMDLPQVPACARCNGEKANLEHYLASVLPFGGQHADARAVMESAIPRRLENNAKLHRVLAEGMEFTEARMLLPVIGPAVHSLFVYVVRGLLWHHWSVLLDHEHDVRVLSLTDLGQSAFSRFTRGNPPQRVSVDLGNGTFVYEGVRGVDHPQVSYWTFTIFGGMRFVGDPDSPDAVSACLGGFSASKEFFARPAPSQLMGNRAEPAIP